ncbi:hypothetical protein [Cytobacillus pseudoceanisediminis]|uniref:hypothetical protein n=1 Tax=Cytobacillus pseudoceanisediminis TaxID=3051614 RepID=UPI003C2CF0D6
MIFCTIARPNQLTAAYLLANSVKKQHSDAKVALCLIGRKIPPAVKQSNDFDHVVSPKDLGKDFYRKILKNYSKNNKHRALKAPFLNFLFNYYKDEEVFIYLDCFTQVFGVFNELLSLLESHSIIYTPYCLEPPSSNQVLNEFDLLKNGNINGGFLAFRKTKESTDFIKRFLDLIRKEVKNNESFSQDLFIDERCLYLMIGLFDIYIFKDPSYHLAVWNLHENARKLKVTDNGDFSIKKKPIKSMFFADSNGSLEWTHKNRTVIKMKKNYKNELNSFKDRCI